jgi:hypothetical protein
MYDVMMKTLGFGSGTDLGDRSSSTLVNGPLSLTEIVHGDVLVDMM